MRWRTRVRHRILRALDQIAAAWVRLWIAVVTSALVAGGCSTYSGPDPPQALAGRIPASTQPSAATRAVADHCTDPGYAVGTTRVSPQYILAVARAQLEPEYGVMSVVCSRPPNGLIYYQALTPRFDVGNMGQDYSWIQVEVSNNPVTASSEVEVISLRRRWRPFAIGHAFQIFPFPIASADRTRSEKEKQILLDIMQRLGDPTAEVVNFTDLPGAFKYESPLK